VGFGYMLLYAAFVVVALWLLAELLLQNKAPLVWRAVALAGFLGVVGGMGLGSVVIIGLGASAFAAGQTFVTLSVRSGFDTGWSLRRPDGSLPETLERVPFLSGAVEGLSGSADARPDDLPEERVGEVGPVEPVGAPGAPPDDQEAGGRDLGGSDLAGSVADEERDVFGTPVDPYSEQGQGQGPPVEAGQQQVYAMQPLYEDESEGYGIYTGAAQQPEAYAEQGEQQQGQGQQTQQAQPDYGYGGYSGYPQPDPYAAAYQGGYDPTASASNH
jgi:hypothetical protein